LDIDVQGVKRVKSLEHTNNELGTGEMASKRKFRPKYVFIAPPSMDLLLERLKGRGTESEESLRTRTKNAKEEVEYGLQKGVFDYVVVNDDLDAACEEFERIVKEMYGL
jgi:guanylate kinase